MNKKYIILNSIAILLIIVLFIFGDYISPLKSDFASWWSGNKIPFGILFFVLLSSIVPSFVISSLPFKKYPFAYKFPRVFLFFNTLILLLFVYNYGEIYYTEKKELTRRENALIKQAKIDIRNDNVTYRFAGGFPEPSSVNLKIDSIYKRYGITNINTGCIIDPYEFPAQKKYDEIVDPYLEKRNGKNWEKKMHNEIEVIREKFGK